MKLLPLLLSLLAIDSVAAAQPHPCVADASERAPKLLALHLGPDFDTPLSFEPPRTLPGIKNPANTRQQLDVLEVKAFASPRGQYRLRFIYYNRPAGACVLMGQEVLEHASP